MARIKKPLSPAEAAAVRARMGVMLPEEVAAVFGYASVESLVESRSRGRIDLPSINGSVYRTVDVEKALARKAQQARRRRAA